MTKRVMPSNWNQLRHKVRERDNGICWCCGESVSLNEYHLGHIVDVRMGGGSGLDNLAVMCKECNLRKWPARTRRQAEAMRTMETMYVALQNALAETRTASGRDAESPIPADPEERRRLVISTMVYMGFPEAADFVANQVVKSA